MHSLTLWACAWTGTPRWNWGGGRWMLLILLLLLVSGCAQKPYQPVPECPVVKPPAVDSFMQANPDERGVVMAGAYIAQVRAVAECNNRIRLVNVANQVRDRAR